MTHASREVAKREGWRDKTVAITNLSKEGAERYKEETFRRRTTRYPNTMRHKAECYPNIAGGTGLEAPVTVRGEFNIHTAKGKVQN